MTLRLKEFEWRMRYRVRERLRSSPAAWREYRRVRRPWWRRERSLPSWLARFLPGVGILFMSGIMNSTGKGVITWILFLSLLTITVRSAQLAVGLRSSPRLLIYAHLPISDEQVFDLQWRWFLKTSAWSVVDFTILYSLLAGGVGYGWETPLAGLAMALVQWLVIVASAAASLAYVYNRRFAWAALVFSPNRWFAWVALLLSLCLVGLLIAPFGPSGALLTKMVASFAGLVPPIGWVMYSMGISRATNLFVGWWPALSLSAILFLLPRAYKKLRKAAFVPERALTGQTKQGAVEAWRRLEADGSNPEAFSGITAAIRRREFLKGFDWKGAGWVEKFVSMWLTPRERVVAEFLTAGELRLTRSLVMYAVFWIFFVILIALEPQLIGVMIPIGTFLLFMFFTGGSYRSSWAATTLRNVSGNNIPMYSTCPVGFRQIASIAIKTNLARLALLTPLAAMTVLFGSARGVFTLYGAGMGCAKGMVVIGAITLLTPVVLVSGGTNDGSRWRVVMLMLLWIPVVGAGIVLVVVSPAWWMLLPSSAALVGACLGATALYGRAYDRGWFDLQTKPKETLNINIKLQ